MLNKIWFGLLLVGIIYGLGKATYVSIAGLGQKPRSLEDVSGPLEASGSNGEHTDQTTHVALLDAGGNLTNAAIDAAELAVTICLGLIGVMVLWLGLLNVAKDAGLVDAFAYALGPLMRWLFPDVPAGHPAQGAMLMNMSANILGLDNAATPFGLKAMRELQELNPTSDTATNAMATFLAINTSNVTLLPITIIALRAASGSDNPAAPIGGIILATAFSTVVAVVVVRILQRFPRYQMPVSADPPSLQS